ncbi:hypothetical protein DFA_00955 [Cavenderia fasciculata]|uniref:Uncharacterized protein n=1 Tax=Cavenderia fasciculata TaxID=261658 RepID=F4PUR1_CACFS|nr:uncharacterized protein DFA_00955 [Cavenderia fasciculata]EGG21080.1 hypothetical protein DFA_00955 [Cavenderia fasciculata]|eukprot:XP_004358930.1 hypothetical protein DFA_00955 [Cavenderia fasciculata]
MCIRICNSFVCDKIKIDSKNIKDIFAIPPNHAKMSEESTKGYEFRRRQTTNRETSSLAAE